MFIVLVETAVIIRPSECTLDHPAFGQDSEALAVVGTEDDLQLKAAMGGHSVQELIAIAAVNPKEAKFLAGAAQLGEQEPGVVPAWMEAAVTSTASTKQSALI